MTLLKIISGSLVAIAYLSFIVWAVIVCLRNSKVRNLRIAILDEEGDYLRSLLMRGVDIDPRAFRAYRSLSSYESMLYRFWIPVEKFRLDIKSFYPEAKCATLLRNDLGFHLRSGDHVSLLRNFHTN